MLLYAEFWKMCKFTKDKPLYDSHSMQRLVFLPLYVFYPQFISDILALSKQSCLLEPKTKAIFGIITSSLLLPQLDFGNLYLKKSCCTQNIVYLGQDFVG